MNNAGGSVENASHDLCLKGRKSLTVNGVKDVVGFDEEIVRLRTACGDMTVEGSALHVKILDVERGVVELEGRVDSVFYSEDKPVAAGHGLRALFHG